MSQEKTLAVAINIFRESPTQIMECLQRVSSNLTEPNIRIFLNGPYDSKLDDVFELFACSVVSGENFGTNDLWHLWWLRMLAFFRESKRDICLKIDPDTMVDKRPASFPDADYFGCLDISQRYRMAFVQGGVTGLSQRAIGRILESGILLPGPEKPWIHPPGWDALADDQHLACALRRIGITAASWREAFSQWKMPVANSPIEHAIVHPRYYHEDNYLSS